MKYPFSYIAYGYSHDENKHYEQCGLGICDSFTDAFCQIEQRYGNELISIKHLALHESDCVINVPKDTLKEIIKLLDGYEVCSTHISTKEAFEI